MDPEFLKVLRCPITASPLSVADPDLLRRLNEAIAAGRLLMRNGQPVEHPLENALVSGNQQFAYGIRDEIVNLIADEAMPLDQLQASATG